MGSRRSSPNTRREQRAQIVALLTLVNSARATVCVRFFSSFFFLRGGAALEIDMQLQESKHLIIKHKRGL